MWIKSFKSVKSIEKPKIKLFCFPYAGGSARIFSSWPKFLPSTIEVYGIQLPGREERFHENSITNLYEIVNELYDPISSYIDCPISFFGHSMGALIAFELARRLDNQYKKKLIHLFFSGMRAPHLKISLPKLYNLNDQEFVLQMKTYDGIKNEILENQEILELVLPILKADFTVVETYQYKSEGSFDIPITVFGGIDDALIKVDELKEWQKYTKKEFIVKMFPGNHFFIDNQRHELLQSITQKLNEY